MLNSILTGQAGKYFKDESDLIEESCRIRDFAQENFHKLYRVDQRLFTQTYNEILSTIDTSNLKPRKISMVRARKQKIIEGGGDLGTTIRHALRFHFAWTGKYSSDYATLSVPRVGEAKAILF